MMSTRNKYYNLLSLSLTLVTLTTAGCSKPKQVSSEPLPGTGTSFEAGIRLYEVDLSKGNGHGKLWIYVPENRKGKLPCILVAPAGSRLFHGMKLELGDRPEHLPYVRAGYVVVAYEIDGALSKDPSNEDVYAAAAAFRDSYAGVRDAQTALDYALRHVPNIDPSRIYAAGHSSAGTLALLLAESDPRIKGCIAYAPVCDTETYLGDETINMLDSVSKDYRSFIKQTSPMENAVKLKCPLFLFHSDADENLPAEDMREFAEKVKSVNSNVTLSTVRTGDHYNSMIDPGIPRGIAWLNHLSGNR